MIAYLCERYSGRFGQMIVGTGEVPGVLGFYKSCGFEYSHRMENFFMDNYDHVMVEEGGGAERYGLFKTGVMITINPDRTDTLMDALTVLWEKSVRATHHFLAEEDILALVPIVRTGLSGVGTLVVACDGHTPVAFMGIDADKLEMLFVAPGYFGKGIGRKLAELGIARYGVRYVDVNEQNPQALGFYRCLGFEVFEHTELDGQGNPFPLLKMKLYGKER